MNWLIEEAKKSYPKSDRVILENPETVKQLDDKIINIYFPFILEELKKTGYPYAPSDNELEIRSTWSGGNLARSIVFMLFDTLRYPFFRGELACFKDGFFLNKEFSLGLPEYIDPDFMIRILKDEKFEGMPPSLSVEKPHLYPEQNTYFHITLESGSGFGFRGWSLNNMAKGNIESAIHESTVMYEQSMIDGFSTISDVEDFLKAAYSGYGD